MVNYYGFVSGIWEIRQNMETLSVEILKYGEIVDSWLENHALTWDEMNEKLAQKSFEGREK